MTRRQPDPEPRPDDTDAGYRDTLEEEAYEEQDRERPAEEPADPEDQPDR